MTVALKMYNMELWRNGGRNAAPAENRRYPPNFFSFSRQTKLFGIIWDKLFFLLTRVIFISIFKHFLHIQKNVKCKYEEFLLLKKSLSQMIENCLIWREKEKNFGGIGNLTAVSSQFHIVPLLSNYYAQFQSCVSLFSWVPLTFSLSFKKCHFRHSLCIFKYIHI